MRRTTINISQDLEQQINDLSKVIDTKDMIRVIEAAVDDFHRQHVRGKAVYLPAYTEVYVPAESEDERGAFRVREILYGIGSISYLKKAESFKDALEAGVFFVPLHHAQEYPYASADYEDIPPDNWQEIKPIWMPDKWPTTRYASAAMVATPQATLAGPGGEA